MRPGTGLIWGSERNFSSRIGIVNVLKDLSEAFRRTAKWGCGLLRGDGNPFWNQASNMIQENLFSILVAAVVLSVLGLEYLSTSIPIASFSLIALGDDVTIVTRLLKVGRLFATPIDELAVGSLLTLFFGIAFLSGAWNYFKSQWDELRD